MQPTGLSDEVAEPRQPAQKPIYNPLPDPAFKWTAVFWVWLLPQAILGILNWRMLSLVWGDMSHGQRDNGILVYILHGAVMVACLTMGLIAKHRHDRQHDLVWWMQFPLLLLPIGYLCSLVFWLNDLVPQAATLWILPLDQFYYAQFAFMMPGIFYGAMLLACFPTHRSRRADIGLSAAIAVMVPGAWFLTIQVLSALHPSSLPYQPLIALFLLSTVILGAALIRALVGLYHVVNQRGPVVHGALTVLVGLAAPIGGLIANRHTSFPADFQSPAVYVFTILNGLVLLVPTGKFGWPLRCAFFPFTLYFFAVFLPFLPLSLLAILLVGAGVLILAPVLLFLNHGQKLIDDFRAVRVTFGTRTTVLIGVAAFALLPGSYTIQCIRDKVSINRALDYVYTPDYRAWGHFDGSRFALRQSLLHLHEFKEGKHLPFLSGYYNWLVFDNLVLPDEKLEHLYQVFFGEPMPQTSRNTIPFFNSGGRGSRSTRETRNAPSPAVSNCVIDGIETETQPLSGETRTVAKIRLENQGAAVGEFAGLVTIPEGVLVSGFWLHIGKERVAGRLFDKKTAIWVYEKIRDVTRRDPGILFFRDPHTAELRVYPLEPHETRTVEIEFLTPQGASAQVKIGERTVELTGNADGIWAAPIGAGSEALVFGPGALSHVPTIRREPYLHFIVNRSGMGPVDAKAAQEMVQRISAQFPDAHTGRVTAANYECMDANPAPQPLTDLEVKPEILPSRGGFLAAPAIKRALLQYQEAFSGAPEGSPWISRYPVLIVLGSTGGDEKNWHLEDFARIVPDAPEVWVYENTNAPRRVPFVGSAPARNASSPVAILRKGDTNLAVAVEQAGAVSFGGKPGGAIQYLDQAGRFQHLDQPVTPIPAETRLSKGLGLWADNLSVTWNPSKERITLPLVVQQSRQSGVLVPATSYIVVENHAQWETLSRKEKNKLRQNGELEIEETPEPSTVILLGLGAGYALLRRRRRM